VDSTDKWVALALKRVLRLAAEGGYDQVAWTPGEVQADRYDLSKQVDSIRYIARDDGTYDVWAANEDGGSISDEVDKQGLTPAEIEDFVGKEVAKKIVDGAGRPAADPESPEMILSGVDLKVGGEGMTAFYDKIVPKVAQKVARKLDKTAKVGVGELDVPAERPSLAFFLDWAEVNGDTRARPELATAWSKGPEDPSVARFLAEQKSQEVWTLPITDAMRESAMVGQPLFQNQPSGENADVSFKPDGSAVISLFKTANKSSLIHEMSHVFLRSYMDLQLNGQAPERVKILLDEIYTWAGFTPGQALTAEEYTALHEKFARAFEAYLMEGKAPTKDLAEVFHQFSEWLIKIYRHVRSLEAAEGFTMDDDIRRVFDRLLATDEQLAAAEEYHLTYDAATATWLDALDLTEDERKRLEKRRAKAKRTSVKARRSRLMKAYLKALADKTKDPETGRKRSGLEKMTIRARDEVEADPVYQAADALAGGEGLSADALDEIVGEEDRKALSKKRPGSVSKTGGRDPAMVAEEFGFAGPEALVDAILDSPTKTEAIRAKVDEFLADAEAEINQFAEDPDAFVADNDYHNDERLRLLTETISILERKTGQPKQLRDAGLRAKALRATAKAAIGRLTVKGATAYRKFSAQEVRARKNADKARKAGNEAEMLRWLNAEALSHAMVIESVKAREAAAKIRARIKKAPGAKLDNTWQQQLYGVLNRLGMAKPGQLEDGTPGLAAFMAMLAGAAEGDSSAAVPAWSDWLLNGATIDQEAMTFEQMQELDDLVKWLRHQGALENRLLTYEGTIDEKVEEVTQPMVGLKPKPIVDGDNHPILKRWSDTVRQFIAEHEMLGFLLDKADGFRMIQKKVGAQWRGPNREMHDRVAAAQSNYDRRVKKINDALKAPLAVLQAWQKQHGHKAVQVDVPVPAAMAAEGRGWTAERIVAAALNMGNFENMIRLVQGFGLADTKGMTPGQVPDVLWELTKPLGAEQWAAIQEIWDVIEAQYPDLAGVHQRVNGFRMAKVEATPLALPDGTVLRGGYYPANYDPVLNKRAGQWSEKDDLLNRTEAIFQTPTAKSGMTKARAATGGGRPLNLSLHVLMTHLDDVARYTTHAEVVRDVDRITQHKDYEKIYKEKFGRQAYGMIRPALRWAARPQGEIGATLDHWADRTRSRATAYVLALNFSVAAKQMFSLPAAVRDMGLKNYTAGIAKVLRNPIEARRMMREVSPYMETRSRSFDRELADALRNFNDAPKELAGWTMADVRDAAFGLIKAVDFMTVFPVWIGAYQNQLAATNGNIEEAVQYADATVRNSQPSAKPIDLNHIMRSKLGIHRIFSFFMTFTAKYANRQRHFYRAMRQGKITRREYLTHLAVEAFAPPVLMSLMFSAMWGNLGADWEDPEDAMLDLLGDVLLYQTSGYIFVRDIASMAMSRVDKRRFRSNPWDSPIWTGVEVAERALTAATKGDNERLAWAVADLVAFHAGVPVPRVARKLLQGLEQYSSGEGTPVNVLIPEPRKR
jgi:hypothetical protein